MAKMKLKIQGMSCQHCVKTVTDALTGLEGVQSAKVNLRKNEAAVNFDPSRITSDNLTKTVTEVGFEVVEEIKPIPVKYLGAVLILLLSAIGCSDVPYTGPVLTVDNVDRYLDSVGEDTACLQDGFDSICLKRVEREEDDVDYNVPIIHVYPSSLIFLFYYEDSPILRAERLMDTTQIVQELLDKGLVQLAANDNTDGDNSTVSGEWVIQIYYSDTFSESNRGQTLKTSGLDITVVEGMPQKVDSQGKLEIKNFEQIDGSDGTRGVQFSIETEAKDITIEVGGLVTGYTAKFYINVDGVASDEVTNTLQLLPLQ